MSTNYIMDNYINSRFHNNNSTMVDKHKQELKTSDMTYTVHVWLEQLHYCQSSFVVKLIHSPV